MLWGADEKYEGHKATTHQDANMLNIQSQTTTRQQLQNNSSPYNYPRYIEYKEIKDQASTRRPKQKEFLTKGKYEF